ncbi:hypothetical protein Pint_11492 [Pistacia integerrima]|uniref:Uncharacterized protein n=1 Tax=Pistacia integerrima TaxID=434235 RepID=A0ACC0XFI5_9ROSI|nr:hypothetical protein Pint_11492 [Pistacia integerrima]
MLIMGKLALGSNNFSGTLPSELGNLVKLEQMWAFDCSLTGKIRDFIGKWELDQSYNTLCLDLSILIILLTSLSNFYRKFRGNSFEGPTPSNFSNLTSLTTLQITDIHNVSSSLDFIKNMKNLIILSLRDSLINGSIPSDIGEYQSLQTLSKGFIDSSFAIKCGGGDALKVDKIVYEVDGYDLGGASFVVLDTEKWAVSDAGWYPDGKFNTHVQNTGSQGTGTTIPELYRISRQSPGSLRYYKLSLENGPYNVSLSFAFGDQGSLTWKSHGRHVFDIYIQGTLRSKGFDISKKAGGDRRAITEKFNAMVTENYLEIQLFWAGKGTCCIPTGGSYGPLISALSVIPDFTPTVGIARKKNQTWLVVVLLGIGPKPKTFSYAELGSATKDFKSPNKLGEGGFGPVYKVSFISYIYK